MNKPSAAKPTPKKDPALKAVPKDCSYPYCEYVCYKVTNSRSGSFSSGTVVFQQLCSVLQYNNNDNDNNIFSSQLCNKTI